VLVRAVSDLLRTERLIPDFAGRFDFSNPLAHMVTTQLRLLALTVARALDWRFRVLPKCDEARLTDMAWHIVPVTVLSVLFVAVGVSFRTGWLY
jgi:hypothetical protein